jgi:opacity protein-like surface antigen
MKKLYLFVALFVAGISALQAQEETVFNRYGGVHLTGVWGGWNNSVADFRNNFNLSSGGYFTFEINNDLLIGWSGYKSDITSDGRDVEIKGNDLLLGYAFRSDRLIHPLFYLQMGSSKLEIQDVGSDRVFVAQPTIGAEINITRFFKLGLDGGYRYFSGSNLAGYTDKDFSGPVLGLRFKFGWSWD